MKIDIKKIKGIAPKMVDPIRLPKVIVPLEKEFKESYKNQQNRMLVDLTKAMIDMKTK